MPPLLTLQLAGALALAQPTSVFTEWTLLDRAPRVEHVTTRADYRRADGPVALLPRVLRRGPRPTARVAGTGAPLTVVARPEGWCVALPPGERPDLRVVATAVRPIERPRAFRATWPRFVAEGVPSRQLVLLPRWYDGHVGRDWSCPREALDETPCVTRVEHPSALVTHVPPLPSPPLTRPLAALLAALAIGAAVAFPPGGRRLEGFAGAAGGATVGLALALALVGASVVGWGPALCWTVAPLVGLGVLASTTAWGRVAASLALAVVPLAAVLGARVEGVIGLTAAAACAVLAAAALRRPASHG